MGADFKFEVDSATGYLDNAVTALRNMAEGLEQNMLIAKKENLRPFPEWVLDQCCGIFVIIRELDRIAEDLKTAVTWEYGKDRSENCDQG